MNAKETNTATSPPSFHVGTTRFYLRTQFKVLILDQLSQGLKGTRFPDLHVSPIQSEYSSSSGVCTPPHFFLLQFFLTMVKPLGIWWSYKPQESMSTSQNHIEIRRNFRISSIWNTGSRGSWPEEVAKATCQNPKLNTTFATRWSYPSVNTTLSKVLYVPHSSSKGNKISPKVAKGSKYKIPLKSPNLSILATWNLITFCIQDWVLYELKSSAFPWINFHLVYNSRRENNLSSTDQFLCFKKTRRYDYSYFTKHIQGS